MEYYRNQGPVLFLLARDELGHVQILVQSQMSEPTRKLYWPNHPHPTAACIQGAWACLSYLWLDQYSDNFLTGSLAWVRIGIWTCPSSLLLLVSSGCEPPLYLLCMWWCSRLWREDEDPWIKVISIPWEKWTLKPLSVWERVHFNLLDDAWVQL